MAEPRTLNDLIAERFHNAYEALAPEHGYTTRAESAVPWVPGGESVSLGICGDDSGVDGPDDIRFRCALLAGHTGAHQTGFGKWGSTAVWTAREEANRG